MTDLITKTANVALFALAALPFVALATARAEPVTVRISDLNMSKPAHVQELNRRVDRASNQLCGEIDARQLGPSAACSKAVHEEARDKLTERQAMASGPMPSR